VRHRSSRTAPVERARAQARPNARWAAVWVVTAVLVAGAPVAPAGAEHNRTCHPPPPPGPGARPTESVSFAFKAVKFSVWAPALELDIVAEVNPRGNVVARGGASMIDGTSTTILISETPGAGAACADTNDDGVFEVVGLSLPLRVDRTSERFLATVTPTAGGIAASGRYQAMLAFDRRFGSFEVIVDAVVRDERGRPATSTQGDRQEPTAP